MAGTGGEMESVAAARPEGAAQPFRDRLVRVLAVGEVGVLAALVLIIAFFYLLEPAFLSDRNIRAILTVVSFVGIIAIGQTILLVNGEFDLSVGSVAGLSAVSSAKLMTALALPVPLAIFGGMLVGARRRPRQRPRRGHASAFPPSSRRSACCSSARASSRW